jgi:hypothetical protein
MSELITNSTNLKELKKMASERNISGRSKMTKVQLINALNISYYGGDGGGKSNPVSASMSQASASTSK